MTETAENLTDPVENDASTEHVHRSDCALHNGPAFRPEPCNCGANPGELPDASNSTWDWDAENGDVTDQPEPPQQGIDPLMLAQSVLFEAMDALAKQKPGPRLEHKIAFGHAWATFSLAQATWQQVQFMAAQHRIQQGLMAQAQAAATPKTGLVVPG